MSDCPAIYGFVPASLGNPLLLFRRNANEVWMIRLRGSTTCQAEAGSRFVGTIEPALCDISNFGTYFVYYAIAGEDCGFDMQYACWTAVCRPPWARAVVFLPYHTHDGGGGTFSDYNTVTLDPGTHPAVPPESLRGFPFDLTLAIGPHRGPRACDWGWAGDAEEARKPWRSSVLHRRVVAASCDDGFVGGAYTLEHDGERMPLDGATWADVSASNQLLIATGSVLTVYHGKDSFKEKRGMRFDLAEIVAAKDWIKAQ